MSISEPAVRPLEGVPLPGDGLPGEGFSEAAGLVADFLSTRHRVFVLTGAGVSTGSGIPDYRDERGEWKRRQPVTYQELVKKAAVRRRYWARSMIGFRYMHGAAPNAAHYALAELERLGRTSLLVTQNVDGLHQKAGSQNVLDLHGRIDRIECLGCGTSTLRADHQRRLESDNEGFMHGGGATAPDGDADLIDVDYEMFRVPDCDQCGGLLKPSVVFFGENVPGPWVERAYAALEASDGVLIVGTSLMVFSGYRFAIRASKSGIPLAVVNRGRTRADDLAALKVQAEVGQVLEAAVKLLGAAGSD